MQKVRQWDKDLQIIKVLTINALKIKYKRSKLGLFWSILNPVLNIAVISFVFARLTSVSYSQFIIFYFSGYLAWSLFANSVTIGTNSFINNEALIKKVPINLFIFPAVSIGVSCVEFILATLALSVIALFLGLKISIALLILPYSLLSLLIFTAGVTLIVSVITAFFRDFAYIITVLIQLWFYLTPILYSKNILSGKAEFLLVINPMAYYIDLFREPIVYGTIPSFSTLAIALLFSLGFLAMGLAIFKKHRSRIIFGL
ncbi:MAG: type transporter [Gammaproteobacteria bacterium]|jgi:ABC-2 type transport system permease protein/lipopolysaccharide transport system permease protein|nr:type transporter [Gammaproteobacteria bacterium]